jgi:alkaline phosphatase D
MNQPPYDRPGKPYGGDSSIFDAMAKENSNFMLWLGDNWYTREVDYLSTWGLWERAHRDRSRKVLQPLLKKMSNMQFGMIMISDPTIWEKSFILKEDSRNVFTSYWANPFLW